MVKCPKCQFEQPEDVFCANCGVNMQTFKVIAPKTKPVIIGLVAVCAAAVLWGVVRFSQSVESGIEKSTSSTAKVFDELNSELDKNKTPQTNIGQATPPAGGALPPAMKAFGKQANTESGKGFSLTGGAEKAPDAKPPLDAATTAAVTTADSAGKISNQITMEFALITKEALDKIQLGVGRVSSNIMSKAQLESLNKDVGFKSLSTESHTLNAGQPTLFSQGTQEPRTKENIGFFIEIIPTRMSDNSADYKISIRRSIPEVSPQGELKVNTQSFSEAITLNAVQAFGISGLLPRKQIMENEDALYKNNVLRALLEPAFQKFDEEFVVIMNP